MGLLGQLVVQLGKLATVHRLELFSTIYRKQPSVSVLIYPLMIGVDKIRNVEHPGTFQNIAKTARKID